MQAERCDVQQPDFLASRSHVTTTIAVLSRTSWTHQHRAKLIEICRRRAVLGQDQCRHPTMLFPRKTPFGNYPAIFDEGADMRLSPKLSPHLLAPLIGLPRRGEIIESKTFSMPGCA